jgi:hypothetical protein
MSEHFESGIEFIDLTEEDIKELNLPNVGKFKVKIVESVSSGGDTVPPDSDSSGGGDSGF